jgi:tripeptide aminopeptidase
MENILDRFLKLVAYHTTSDIESESCPSTINQLIIGHFLVKELNLIGLSDVKIDENGYVTATLESNCNFDLPTIGFIAHLDTSPDFCGKDIIPNIITNYNGKDIILNSEDNIVLEPTKFPELKNYIGQTIITTNGKTLLGADDKAGITAILCAMEYLINNPQISHGKIRICFTPDEEIGRGADLFNVEEFGADWAYTIDGGEIGEHEYENFNAASATIIVKGKSVHPGYSYNKMLNANLLVNEIINLFPTDEIPSKTQNYEGFYHITYIDSHVSTAQLQLIIRDHSIDKFNERKLFVENCIHKINHKYGKDTVSVVINDQYFNMRDKILPVFHIVELAKEAMKKADIEPKIKPVRGGTDGSRLSFMGLPCPNIFAGGHNFHGPYEFVPVESIAKARDVIVNICNLATK